MQCSDTERNNRNAIEDYMQIKKEKWKKKERERERENGIERALRQRKTIDETFYIVTTTIQSWHGSWRHLLRFGIRYDKVGAEKLHRGDN